MRLKLKADKSIEFLDGSGTINTNDVMRQLIEVEAENGVIATGERLWITYQCEADKCRYTGEILMYEESGVFRSLIPREVLQIPGKWTLQLFVRLYSATEATKYITQLASMVKEFTVQNGLVLEDGEIVNNGTVDALYKDANNAVTEAKSAAEQAQEAVTNVTNIINTAKVGFSYDEENEELTLSVFTETDTTA